MIIGLTGLIGSGKTEVARVWAKLGARIINCDDIGREVVEQGRGIIQKLVREFGSSILNKNGKLNRRRLGERAFSSRKTTEMLNSIVHPALLARLDHEIAFSRENNKVTIVDAALLIYWNYQKKMDFTVLVSSFQRLRYQRLIDRGLTLDEIRQRTHSQLTLKILRSKSDYVLHNNTDLANLRLKARKLYLSLTEKEVDFSF